MRPNALYTAIALACCACAAQSTQSTAGSSSAAPSAAGTVASRCTDFSAQTCPEATCSTLRGRVLDAAANCLGLDVAVGCEEQRACDDALTYAKGPDGRIFRFSNTCIPRDFTLIQHAAANERSCPAP